MINTPSLVKGRGFPRGRKAGGLRNRDKMVGTGHDSWRTNTRGLGGGRSAALPSIFLGAVSLPNRGSEVLDS